MPALNEEQNLEFAVLACLNAFDLYEIDGEVIVVNDGSSDQTQAVLNTLQNKYHNIKGIHHESPMGIGYSFIDGVKNSTKDVVVMFPGDGENDPEDSLRFFNLMEDVDIVVPFIHNVEIRNKARRFISSLYRSIINISFGINLNYTNGTVFYKRIIMGDVELKSFGFFYQAELLIKLIRKGYLYAEIPNFLSKRHAGKSKAVTLKSLMQIMLSFINLFYEIHLNDAAKRKINYNLAPGSVSHQRSSAFSKSNTTPVGKI